MKPRKAFVTALLMVLLGLLAMLGGAMATLGSAGLVGVRQSVQSERALALADAGLSTAASRVVSGGVIAFPFTQSFPDEGSFTVERRINSGNSAMSTPWGITMPPKSTLLRSTGTTPEGTRRSSVALFRSSIGAFQVGALADDINGVDSTFDAYDSTSETPGWMGPGPDPASRVTDATILASNRVGGLAVELSNSTVDGAIFVGGNTATQIALTSTTVGLTGILSSPIAQPNIVVPTLPNGPTPTNPSTSGSPKVVSLVAPNGKKDTTIAPPSKNGNPVVITHYCLTMKVWPDGRFSATEGGSGCSIAGDIQDGTYTTTSSAKGGKAPLVVQSYNPLSIRGNWHHAIYDPANQQFSIDQNGITSPAPTPVLHAGLPGWIFFDTPPPAATSPSTLIPGKYDTVNVQASTTNLVDDGVYVIKNLRVDALGKLHIGSATTKAQIYVTGSLIIDGPEAIVNDSRKPTGLRIFYTGTSPVTISGGGGAFATLYAPKAPVTLEGYGSEFFGAISSKSLTVNNAQFHYDVATQGVGTGLDATAFQLLGRYHL